MNGTLKYVVANRHPLWLPALNTGLPPVFEPGDWILSSWLGRCSQYAIRVDLGSWMRDRTKTIWNRFEYPPMGLLPKYTLEILPEGQYDDSLLAEKGWIEVLGYAD